MIIHHIDWVGNKICHRCKTVREFINEELMKIDGKENKYFRICTKKEYYGKKNLLLYFQDGKLKSHHSTQIAFDYNDVLDYEIYGFYSMDDLKVTNIVSVDCDCLEEFEKKLKEKDEEVLTFNLETIGMPEQEKIKYYINKVCEDIKIKGVIKSNECLDDDIVVKALRMLFKETDEIVVLNNKIAELERRIEQQSQQIQWLGKYK